MKRKKPMLVALLFLVFIFVLTACSEQTQTNEIACEGTPYSGYSGVLANELPMHYITGQDTDVFSLLNRGAAVEALDTQANIALEAGIAAYWYPEYLATVIIAVDRDQTDAQISGWVDLAGTKEQIGLVYYETQLGHVFSAISYGMEGGNISMRRAAATLSPIYDGGNLLLNSFDAPVLICFDYQAAGMAMSGRNIEIIVPEEGTLSFEKGLLSNAPIDMPDTRDALLSAGFRLIDEACNESIYPTPEVYRSAAMLYDYAGLNAELQNTTKAFRRDLRHTRLYSSADGQEHQLFAIIYIIAVILWTDSILHRAMQRGVRRSAFICSIFLILWMLVRTLKYSFPVEGILTRHLWYGFYIFEHAIPPLLIWMSISIDKPEDTLTPPKWWFGLTAVNVLLVLMVLTNDLHQLSFRMDISGNGWNLNYSYGPVYFAAIGSIVFQVILSQIIMVRKCRHDPRKFVFLFPVGLYLLLMVYGIAYVMRIPFAWDSDMTLTVGIFTLLYMEICVQIGLMPVNRKYRQFFEQSPQNMQIVNDFGEVAIMSVTAAAPKKETWNQLCEVPGKPLPVGNTELLFADKIHGGMVIWREDIRSLNILNHEIESSMKRLQTANAILESEEIIGRNRVAAKAQIVLFAGMEKTISLHTKKLSDMLRNIPSKEEHKEYMTRVATMVCYIKRCCYLFFLKQKSSYIAARELAIYMDEIAELAQYAGINCRCTCTLSGQISLEQAALMYDFAYAMLDWLFDHNGKSMLVQIEGEKDGGNSMTAMQSAEISAFIPNAGLLTRIEAAGGDMAANSMEALDSSCFYLTFSAERSGNNV